MSCGNPECSYPANDDPEISIGFCCEKCEGRFNGEEWAMTGKKKHTAYCSCNGGSGGGGGGGDAWGGGYGPAKGWGGGAKCAHPECEYMKHSDRSVSARYCCEKCEGMHTGEEWAEGGKRHYKSCEKIEVGGGGDGYGGGEGGWGKGGGKKGWAMSQMMQMMGGWGGDMGWDGFGKGKAKGGGKGFGKDKGKSSGPNLKDFQGEQKVWVGGLPEGIDLETLTAHFGLAGGVVKFAVMLKGNTAGVAFETTDEAANAVLLNGSDLMGSVIQVDAWTGN